MKIYIAGCGALGSQIALNIASQEHEMVLIDFDRIDENNIATSAYSTEHIGMLKTDVLAGLLYYKHGVEAEVVNREVGARFFAGIESGLVIDCFDNHTARLASRCSSEEIIHIGVSPQMIGAVTWDEQYRNPTDIDEENVICTHQLGRNIILLTSSVASVAINQWLSGHDEKRNYIVKEHGIEVF